VAGGGTARTFPRASYKSCIVPNRWLLFGVPRTLPPVFGRSDWTTHAFILAKSFVSKQSEAEKIRYSCQWSGFCPLDILLWGTRAGTWLPRRERVVGWRSCCGLLMDCYGAFFSLAPWANGLFCGAGSGLWFYSQPHYFRYSLWPFGKQPMTAGKMEIVVCRVTEFFNGDQASDNQNLPPQPADKSRNFVSAGLACLS
jgi:hypothetical protein